MVTKGTTPGSIQQTLFMGASVIGFTAGLGWNEQSGQVVIQLVEDTASILADKFYLDAALQNQVWTGADPGFSKPTVGSAAMFKFGDFEFEGIVQSWKRLDSVDGNPTWEITLTDPREILAGTQLITGGYQGPILNNVANILNVYGFWESFGNRCPESLSGGFGGARTNEGGMPWNNILVATLVLTSNLPRQFNSYSPYGRLKFKDGGKDGFGAVSGDQYLVDLSLMPTAPPFYRLGGDSISLLEAISQVCQDGGSDFFVSLHFVHHNGELLKIIKLRTVSRRNIPTLGVIESFVSDHDGAVSKDVGRELRNEVNSAALIGGDIELIHEAFDNGLLDNDATFWPYWGLNSNNTPVIGVGLNDDHQFLADSTYLNMPEIGDSYLITVAELRAALAGQDIWETFMELGKKDIADALNIYPRWSASKIVANFGGSVSEFFPSDSNASQYAAIQKGAARKLDTSLLDKINILYSFVRAYATEFYGKKYLVRLPFVCAKRDSLTFEITYSVEVSNSGWTDFESGVAGLDTPALLDIFRDDQGKLTAFLGFTNVSNLDLSNLNPDDVAYEDDEIFIRCSVDEKIIFNNNTTFSYPRVVVTLPSLISLKSAVGDEPAIRRFIVDHVLKPSPLNNYQGIPLTPAESDILYKQLGELDGQGGYGALPVRPASAALPFKSNIGVYGPWFVSGSHGKVQFEKDESLVPWNFGGTTLMNVAGNDKIAQALTFMQESELGSIELPEPPTIFLGEELGSDFTWPIENRFLTLLPIGFGRTTIFFVAIIDSNSLPSLDGLRGANVSNIDVRVGEAGVLTTLKMQTFTPKFLGIFGKDNASVLSKLGQREHKLRRTIRANRRPKPPPEIFSQLNPDFFGGHMGRTGVGTSKSAHPILVGQQINYNSNTEQRTNIRFMSFEESKTELGFNYDSKSFSSLDCLFRPISTEVGYANPTGYTGSGSLTRPCLARNAMEAIPPFKTQPDLDAGYINLDPFLNPGKGLLSSNNAGHDIEYMIHSNEMIDDVHIRLTSDYGVGYRTFGLRAPLVLTGWGLDLEGKPVPNSTPNTPSDTYADNWLKKPTNWKTGPLDLRWDENRGVWTSWPGYKLLKIEFDTALAEHGVANATVLDDVTQYGAGGDVVGKTIEVTGCLDGQIASDGDQALAYYDTRTCSYCPILSAGGGSNIVEGLLKEGMPEGDLCEGTDAILSLYGLGGTECLDFVNNACDNTSISSTDNYGDLNTAVSVINRDVTLSAGINAFCIAEFINGEYRPVYIGCPPCPISGCIEATATVPLTSSQTSSSLVAFGNLTVSDAPS